MDRFKNWKQPAFDEAGYAYPDWKQAVLKTNSYGWRCQHYEKLQLGEKVDIGCFTYLNAQDGIIIGNNVQIGSHCSIYSVSTIDNKEGLVIIKDNAKIGSHTTIMPNVTIGENAIIGAHSFVNKVIPSNYIAFGVPTKIRGKINENIQ